MTESVGPTPEERRLSFGSAAGAYNRYRPGYPAAALRFVLGVLHDSLGVEGHVGAAEQIPLPDASVDGITVGQAFHWFEQERALPEMARVLHPDGCWGFSGTCWTTALTG